MSDFVDKGEKMREHYRSLIIEILAGIEDEEIMEYLYHFIAIKVG